MFVAVPVVGFVAWVNLRIVRFWHERGRTDYHQWGRPHFCSSCGAELTGR